MGKEFLLSRSYQKGRIYLTGECEECDKKEMETRAELSVDTSCPTVWTVGHSNHTLPMFLELLCQNGVEILADVRSSPFSRFAPWFNARDLETSIKNAGLHYAFFGDTLGGRPSGDEFYDEEGHVFYNRVAAASFFHEGMLRLHRGINRGRRIALMCSEENPLICHRNLLIGRVLEKNNVRVLHIRGNGIVETTEALDGAKRDAEHNQPVLFELSEEELEWKSIPSVLPKRPPSGFSGV